MRRARIKTQVTIPVRRKPVQDTLNSIEVNSSTGTEQNKIIPDSEQEIVKEVNEVTIPIQKKPIQDTLNSIETSSSINIEQNKNIPDSEQETVKESTEITIPIQKKLVQDTLNSIETNSLTNTEQNKNISDSEQETVKEITEVTIPIQKKPIQDTLNSIETSSSIDIEQNKNIPDSEQETVKESTEITIPIQKKLVQDTLNSIETNSLTNTEQNKNISDSEQETVKEVTEVIIPVQEKPVQDTLNSIETSSLTDTKQNKDIPDSLEAVERATEVQKNDAVTLERKNENKNVQLKIVKNEQVKIKLTYLPTEKSNIQKPIFPEKTERNSETCAKSDFQESNAKSESKLKLHIQLEPNSQKLCAETKQDSQEYAPEKPSSSGSCNQVNNNTEKFIDHAVQEKIVSDIPMEIDIVSPTKVTQNRPCFMRPIPRLDSSGRIRKNSVQGSGASASESEDEHGKKTPLTPNRIRNDSVCSVQSNKESIISDNQINSPIKTTQKRRMLISESARKLAEARREFFLKHENKTPDRSQLKMYDLIYYNPISNPMTKSLTTRSTEETTITQLTETLEEENEDDPAAMPVPQVKVGPDGQLIIDEKSLVIESSDLKEVKKILARNDVIIEDGNSHGGFYKKRKRGKDWPKWETLKFYRVLNVIGTDFLLMQTFFPNRTRQEIKQKYKKEERVNPQLIEKTLKYHQEFNIEKLKEQLATLDELKDIENRTKKSSDKSKSEQRTTKTAKKRRNRLAAASIGECESLSGDQEGENANEIDLLETSEEMRNTRRRQAKRENKLRKLKHLDVSDKSDDNNSRASSKELDSDSDQEIYQVRPTRSGRLPKLKKFRPNDEHESNAENMSSVNSVITTSSQEATEIINMPVTCDSSENASCSENLTTMISNMNEVEPGSLVILSKESTEDPGNTILQVYMVNSNIDTANTNAKYNIMPVDLPPKLLTTVTNKLEKTESINMSSDCQ